MGNFFNRFLESFDKVFDIIKDLKGFAKFAALIIVLAVLLTIFLSIFGKLTSDQTTFILAGLFVLFLIVLFLSYKDTKRLVSDGRFYINICVHEEPNKTRWIDEAVVKLGLTNPLERKTDERGTVSFSLDGTYTNKKFPISASKEGFETKERAIKLVRGRIEPYYIPLKIKIDPHERMLQAKGANKLIMLGILAQYPGGMEAEELKRQVGIADRDFDEVFAEMRDFEGLVSEVKSEKEDRKYITGSGKKYLGDSLK